MARSEARGTGEAGPDRMLLLAGLAAVIGLVAALAASALYRLIALVTSLVFFHHLSFDLVDLRGNPLGGWVVVVTVLGGLVVGLMAEYGSDKIRGHGIPEAMEAVLVHRSRISPRVAILKPLSAALAIGTGGPFGAEGPIIQTGGALGSLVGQILHVTAAERKVLLACGAAAGMSATFSTPIAAVILAIELLLFEFKSRSFIPLVIASTLATAARFTLMGRGATFTVGDVDFGIPQNLAYYVLLGVVCGLAAVGLTRALYWVEDRFEHLPVPPVWWPALGGLVLGTIGFFFPQVLGVGYGVLSDTLNGRLALEALLVIVVFKTLALLVTLGSGTSGGLLAPTFMVSAALGGAFAITVNRVVPGAHLAPEACALVAMAAVFGAASRATFTFIIFAFELTRDYDAVLPLMLTGVIADAIALVQMPHSIMTEKLARRGLAVHHEYEADVLRQVQVADVMERNVPQLAAQTTVAELMARIAAHDPSLGRHHAFPIVDAEGRLAGIITRGDVVRAVEDGVDREQPIVEAGSRDPVVAFPDESVHDALARMLRHGFGRLLVVEREDPRRLIGYLGRSGILEARQRRHEEEQVREPGWLGRRAR